MGERRIELSTEEKLLRTLKRPSAFLPIVMSLLAVGVVLTHIALFGTARQQDEGAAAHLWQLLIGGQVPIVLFFAMKRLPQAPRDALAILCLQAAAALAAVAPVYLLHW
jgi:peptidoglycan/LPS O-acetylase OafA/YrhL